MLYFKTRLHPNLPMLFFKYISYGASRENLFNNQELLKLVIILMTIMYDSEVIL